MAHAFGTRTAAVAALFVLGAGVACAQEPPPGPPPGGMPAGMPPGMPPGMPGMPAGMPGMPPGGPPMMPGGPPARAAIYIADGAEDGSKEYVAGQYRAHVKSDARGIRIVGANLSSGDYTYTGVVASGEKSVVTLERVQMHLGVTQEADAKAQGGAALSASNGATVYLDHSDLVVDGAQRYVTETGGTSRLVVNDSKVTQTGGNAFTTKMTEPFSNDALLISGIARANMSVGRSQTYYFNSTVTTEGWAALSTDAGAPGLNLYAYNTRAIARHGGYGTYADFNCSVWLYGSTLESAEIGAIIAKSGHITIADGASAPAEVVKLDTGRRTSAGSVVTGGRNAVMIHAPDMMGQGLAAADAGKLDVVRSTLATDRRLKGTRDYARHISPAVAAYIDYTAGADVLIKSTSGDFDFDGVTFKSYSNVLVMTALNSDKWGNFLRNESDGAAVKPIAVNFRNLSATGDIRHMDYQRIMALTLEQATLKGAIVSGSLADWNALWTKFERKSMPWVVNDRWDTFHGVRLTLKDGGKWIVTAPSLLAALRLEDGATLAGRVEVDGEPVTPAGGQAYAGRIVVTPL
ncbi:MAG: hypothetical protein U1F30_06395 [Steroidobacteraceae bacterium]